MKVFVVYCLFIIILIIITVIFLPRKCFIDGHDWREFFYKGERRRKCVKCSKQEFWNTDIADVIEAYTGKSGQGQWNHVKYSKADKNGK